MSHLTFAQRLAEAASRKGLTANGLATLLQKSASLVNPWFTGERKPSAEYLLRLPELLECSADYLFYGRGDIEPITPDAASAKLAAIRSILNEPTKAIERAAGVVVVTRGERQARSEQKPSTTGTEGKKAPNKRRGKAR